MKEDVTKETTIKILDAFKKGEKPVAGPQNGRRKYSEPFDAPTSLIEPPSGPSVTNPKLL